MIKIEYNFSPSLKLSAINPENVIEAFKERIEQYYFEPLKLLNKKKFGFAATAILASLLDILAKVENRDTENSKNRIKYTSWMGNNLELEPELAKFFYDNFRCGLLHSGCIESGGQISYSQKESFLLDNAHFIINPNSLMKKLKKIFYNLIKKEDPVELYNYLRQRLVEIS